MIDDSVPETVLERAIKINYRRRKLKEILLRLKITMGSLMVDA